MSTYNVRCYVFNAQQNVHHISYVFSLIILSKICLEIGPVLRIHVVSLEEALA